MSAGHPSHILSVKVVSPNTSQHVFRISGSVFSSSTSVSIHATCFATVGRGANKFGYRIFMKLLISVVSSVHGLGVQVWPWQWHGEAGDTVP